MSADLTETRSEGACLLDRIAGFNTGKDLKDLDACVADRRIAKINLSCEGVLRYGLIVAIFRL